MTPQPVPVHGVIPAAPGAELHTSYKDHEVSVQSLSFSGSFWVEPAATSPNLVICRSAENELCVAARLVMKAFDMGASIDPRVLC